MQATAQMFLPRYTVATQKQLYAYACVLVKSRNDAEDLVQECFARIASCIGDLNAVNDLEPHLLKIVRNEAFRFRSRWLRWHTHNEAAGNGKADIVVAFPR
jgi:DNA-directed RNA polymerase specialized sigma24 family protein